MSRQKLYLTCDGCVIQAAHPSTGMPPRRICEPGRLCPLPPIEADQSIMSGQKIIQGLKEAVTVAAVRKWSGTVSMNFTEDPGFKIGELVWIEAKVSGLMRPTTRKRWMVVGREQQNDCITYTVETPDGGDELSENESKT